MSQALGQQQCPFTRQSKLIRCASDLSPSDTRIRQVNTPGNFSQECRNECVYRNNVLGLPCTAFIYRDATDYEVDKRNTCIFFPCVTDIVDAPKSSAVSIIMSAPCFATPAPTLEPTTPQPTLRPTTIKPSISPTFSLPTVSPSTPRPSAAPSVWRPTVAPTTAFPTRRPTKFPTLAQPSASPVVSTKMPTSTPTIKVTLSPHTFQSPTGIQDWAPFDAGLFQSPYQPDTSTCMVVRPSFGSSSITYANFGGTRQDCLKECQYTPFCNGILFSVSLNTCMLANTLETSDVSEQVDDFAKNWVAVLRTGVSMRYYNSFWGTTKYALPILVIVVE
ncbi:hypothetical protein BASA81_003765 [Batrachochytrium salamandrivorans]|nr:hypothetical protein BASA81_003765 [Batrachochytrium salamandrivorans]